MASLEQPVRNRVMRDFTDLTVFISVSVYMLRPVIRRRGNVSVCLDTQASFVTKSVRKVFMVKTVMSLVDARMGALVITSRGSVLVLLAGGAGTATGPV